MFLSEGLDLGIVVSPGRGGEWLGVTELLRSAQLREMKHRGAVILWLSWIRSPLAP